MHVRDWLETAEAQDLLAAVARAVLRDVRLRRLPLHFLAGDYWTNDTPGVVSEIRSELALFILECRSRIQDILLSGLPGAHAYLKTAFINHLIGVTRVPDRDRRRYLRKRVADLLRESDGYYTAVTGRREMTFSRVPGSAPIPHLSQEDLREIIFPYEAIGSLEYEKINRKDVLLELARHFWKHVSMMWGDRPLHVHVTDLVNWIGIHVPTGELKRVERLPGAQEGQDNALDLVADEQGAPDTAYFDPERVRDWAVNFSNLLAEKEKAVLYLRREEALTLEDTARTLGFKGPSGPLYHQEQAEEKLRFFLRDLPWLSPDDFSEQAFSVFCDTLFSVLKKSASTP